MKSLDAIDDLIEFYCIEAKTSSWTERSSISIAIKSLCESLAVLGVGRCFVDGIPVDKRGKIK